MPIGACVFAQTDILFCQPIFFLWFNAESILLFLHQQPDVAHLAAVYLKYASIGLPAYAFNAVSRYALRPNLRKWAHRPAVDTSNPRVSLRSQLRSSSSLRQSTWSLTTFLVSRRPSTRNYSPLTFAPVWGPKPIALGFIGAPLATAISFNLISISSIVYGIFFVPNTAWHPISRRTFTSLGVLVRLGLGGVGLSY